MIDLFIDLFTSWGGYAAIAVVAAPLGYLLTRDHPVWRFALLLIGFALWVVVATIAAQSIDTLSDTARNSVAMILLAALGGVWFLSARLKIDEP